MNECEGAVGVKAEGVPSMQALLSQLDEGERAALLSKYRAVEAVEPEPRLPEDGTLFAYDLVDRKGQLTDAGLEAARILEQTADCGGLASPAAETVSDNLLRTDLIPEVRALARKAGGVAALRRLVEALAD